MARRMEPCVKRSVRIDWDANITRGAVESEQGVGKGTVLNDDSSRHRVGWRPDKFQTCYVPVADLDAETSQSGKIRVKIYPIRTFGYMAEAERAIGADIGLQNSIQIET